jgi:MFS family permease
MKELRSLEKPILLAILVAALGYFVDIYDLLLFSIVRVSSLKDLGVGDELLLDKGVLLINTQMAGMLVGGIFWGILGDKKGRLSVLFGSIFMYSVANILNAFVHSVEQYAILRFIAGVGLAGELGAGITLVVEILPQNIRGYGTTIIAAIGIMGAVFGGAVADFFSWRVSYMVGGALGFLILLLRVGVRESGLFEKAQERQVVRGDLFMLFRRRETFVKFLCVILIGIPVWYIVGVLVTFTPEFAKAFGMSVLPTAGNAVMFCYLGTALGDLMSGLFSQWLKSRRRVILFYLIAGTFAVTAHLLFSRQTLWVYYLSCSIIGFTAGYWAMFVTVAAEQFGTNIRSTVTTSVPNFVRGALIPLTMLFRLGAPSLGVVGSGVAVGVVSLILALGALWFLEETFHKNLDYLESDL